MSTFDLLRFERLQQSLFPPSLKNTACVLWIGKNYRLQDIQLSKNPVNLSVDVAATHGSHKLSSRSCASSALHDLANSSASTFALRGTSFASACLARHPKRLAQRAMREGWWRIPGSNR
jgi:hypothetical protein